MNVFPYQPEIVFMCNINNEDDGFFIYYNDCVDINKRFWNEFKEKSYEQKIKPIIFEKCKKMAIKTMTMKEWKEMPKPKPYRVEY